MRSKSSRKWQKLAKINEKWRNNVISWRNGEMAISKLAGEISMA